MVAGFAVTVRLVFLLLTADTYDYDEFVVLLLGRDTAHGAVPYRDFEFFHPPGVLALFAILQPLTHVWWPTARIIMVGVDSISAVLVWRVGLLLYSRREALFAGLLYGLSPVALISAVRVGQDPLITALGLAGVYLLLSEESSRNAVIAGVCLALAVWVKLPGVYFLPIYLLLAPRRTPALLTGFVMGVIVLFLPYYGEFHQLYDQTVTFQRTRWTMPAEQRFETTALYWLVASLPAIAGLYLRRAPAWLSAGFLLGGLFALSSQVYYHYFLVVVPFAALLGGACIERVFRRRVAYFWATGIAIVSVWGVFIQHGGPTPLYVTAAHLSDIAPTVQLLEDKTQPRTPILADRFEYAYLAERPALAHYFWNVGVRVTARTLENRVSHADAVVLSYGASSGYPAGFEDFLNARYPRTSTPVTTTWILTGKK